LVIATDTGDSNPYRWCDLDANEPDRALIDLP
jgi:hypothetical protein